MPLPKRKEIDVSELDNGQFQYHTLNQELDRLEKEQKELFNKMFQVVGKKSDMRFDAWHGLNAKFRVTNCKIGEYLQTYSTIYKRIA